MSTGGHSMRDASLRAEFDKVAEGLKNHWQVKNTLATLRALQETVVELQEQGFSMSLDVRLAGIDNTPYAKGELKIDGLTLDFLITRNSSGYDNEVQFVWEGNVVSAVNGDIGIDGGADKFKRNLRKAIYSAKALSDAYS